jgi:aspartyl/glutamyl-tRNA(Asn/Gln) amidotransferase C subunit
MSAVTPEETEALARLSRLSLGDAERDQFADQLARILAYIDTLQRAQVEGVPEYKGDPEQRVTLRDDQVGAMLAVEDALAGVPATRGGQVLVPKFKED